MFADAAFNWDVSRSQKTQATVATSAIGTQSPPTLLISASSQTEEEFPGDYADAGAEAGPRTYSSPPHSGSTGMVMKPVQDRARRSPADPSQGAPRVLKFCRKILSGGVLHSCKSSEHKRASPQGKVRANNMGYICTVCAKVFYGKGKIDRHMRVHTGERPYSCSVCRKSFTQKEHLIYHERLHSGERPYVCSTCHESFINRGYLVAHERLHSGERPYVCTTCQKSFTAKSYLHKHEKLQHSETPYVCSTNQTGLVNVKTWFLLKE